jgi:hypothetical protein
LLPGFLSPARGAAVPRDFIAKFLGGGPAFGGNGHGPDQGESARAEFPPGNCAGRFTQDRSIGAERLLDTAH